MQTYDNTNEIQPTEYTYAVTSRLKGGQTITYIVTVRGAKPCARSLSIARSKALMSFACFMVQPDGFGPNVQREHLAKTKPRVSLTRAVPATC